MQRHCQRRGGQPGAGKLRGDDGVQVRVGELGGQRAGAGFALSGERRVVGRLGGLLGVPHQDDDRGFLGGQRGRRHGHQQRNGEAENGTGSHAAESTWRRAGRDQTMA